VGKFASILIKLLMDMWLAGTPQATFGLVLSMLQAALRQPDPLHRARVFDLVYNLSLHTHMIESDSPAGAAVPTDSARSSGGAAAQAAAIGGFAPQLLAFSLGEGRDAPQAHVHGGMEVRR
jgi:hypothetical protein